MKTLFGTDGIRGAVGSEPFTTTSLVKLGSALGTWAQNAISSQPRILLGHDTRESASWVKAALQTGLLMHNVQIHDALIVPTPMVCQIIQHFDLFDIGIIISASHNPYQDNGIKIVTKKHGKLSTIDETTITNLFFHQVNPSLNFTQLGSAMYWQEARTFYCNTILHYINKPFLNNITVVLDCAHGATYQIAQHIFEFLGAQVIALNTNPNGKNINKGCGALHPHELQQAVLNHNAHIGFAFDGDGDRVIAVNRHGQIKDGDDILALLLQHPLYMHEKTIVGTIMTNQGFAVHMQNSNKKLLRTPVGDKYISERLTHENMLIGGEQSGHIILRDYMESGDGIFTALRILQSLFHTGNWDMITFEKFPQILMNIPIAQKKDLTLPHLAALISSHEQQLQGGRLIVRYSGTEPLLRIMVEDATLQNAQTIGINLSQALACHLST